MAWRHAYTHPLAPYYHLIDRDIQIPFQLRLSTFSQVNIRRFCIINRTVMLR